MVCSSSTVRANPGAAPAPPGQTATPITLSDAPNFGAFLGVDRNHDGIADVLGVKTRNEASGRVEVHTLDGASNYRSFLTHSATALSAADGPNFEFASGDFNGDGIDDLLAVKVRNTQSGPLKSMHLTARLTTRPSFFTA